MPVVPLLRVMLVALGLACATCGPLHAADETSPAPGALERTERAVVHGAQVAASGVARGAEAAASGVRRAGRATARVVKQGAAAVASGAARGLNAAGRGIERAGQATGQAARKVAGHIEGAPPASAPSR